MILSDYLPQSHTVQTIVSVANLLNELNKFGYKKLIDIDIIVDKTYKAVEAYETKYPPTIKETDEFCEYSTVGVIRTSLAFVNKDYLHEKYHGASGREQKEFLDLIE